MGHLATYCRLCRLLRPAWASTGSSPLTNARSKRRRGCARGKGVGQPLGGRPTEPELGQDLPVAEEALLSCFEDKHLTGRLRNVLEVMRQKSL